MHGRQRKTKGMRAAQGLSLTNQANTKWEATASPVPDTLYVLFFLVRAASNERILSAYADNICSKNIKMLPVRNNFCVPMQTFVLFV